ncbi:hypothetical protein HOY80DRAFT_897518 [Tuber brumale]|nr:hypothetical protein HOY80DRAFT_897518 [Tuber brumale]
MAKLSTFLLYLSTFAFLLADNSLAVEQALQKRQDGQTSDDAATTTVSSPGRTSTLIVTSTSSRQTTSRASTSQPSPATTRAATSATASRQTSQETVTGPTMTRSSPSTTLQGDKPAETTTGSNNDSTSDSESMAPMTTLSPTTRRQVTTIFSTVTSGTNTGQVSTIVSTSTTVETPTVRVSSGGQNQGPNGGSEGLKPATRNTIIGAVVGVGGALLVGGLVIFAWRLKRRRVNPVDEDDLMRRDGSPLAAGRDMRTTSPEESPFKTTLDQYHKPPGTVNASSNF